MKNLKRKITAFILFLGIMSVAAIILPANSYAATLLNAPLISQLPELKNGCEVTSLAMLLQYKGINVDKMTLANQVKKDLTPYRVVGSTVYWGNPNTGFVGDITGRALGYSVYHGPILQLANQYTNSIDLTGNSFDVILHQLDKGKPVWVISTSTFDTIPSNQWQLIQTPLGPLSMTFHEHSVLLTGYDNNYVYFNDPLANIKNRQVSRAAFIRGWEQFGRQAITYGSSMGVLDNPASGQTISDTYNLSGWFLDESGVARVEVLVDGAVAGQAVYGLARPDVQGAYPDYNNGKAGFNYSLDTIKYKNGSHTISIKETGTNGWVTTLPGKTVNISNAKGVIDNPAPDSKIKGNYTVSGWLLDDSGVSKIDVLVDGTAVGQAIYNDPRQDVLNAYPDYHNANAGFHYLLDTTNLTNGKHTITVRETAANGKVTALPERNVTVENVVGYWDQPASGANVKENINVSGWFLDDSGVSKIEVLIDGAVLGETNYGDPRADVQRIFPEFNNGNSGYHYSLDTTKLNDGTHTISIKETGINGKVTTLPEKVVTVANSRGYMDTPAAGATLKGSANVSGWFLDAGGVSKVEVLIDGTVAGQASYNDPRADVQKAYPDFQNANAGYHYLLDTTKFSDGKHKITVRETRTNGMVTTLPEKEITISNAKFYLDTPTANQTIKGNFNVSGWLLDHGDVSKLEVLVDGIVAGQTVYGDPRADVKIAFPEFNNGASGYHYVLDTTKYSDGAHSVTIRETRSNGLVTEFPSVAVTIKNIIGYMDTPVTGSILKGTANVSGWFLDESGVSKIEVWVDGVAAGEAVYGDSRSDVQKAYPEYNNGKSGYHYALDSTQYSNGQHTIIVIETGNNGATTTLQSQIVTIKN